MSNPMEFKKGMVLLLRSLPSTHHVTLTWDLKRGRPSRASVERRARASMSALARIVFGRNWYKIKTNPPPIFYIGVIERSVSGQLHVHLVVCLGKKLTPLAKQRFIQLWRKWAGYCVIKRVYDRQGLAKYLSKAARNNDDFFLFA